MAFIQGEQVEATTTPEEKDARLEHLRDFQGRHAKANAKALKQLQKVAMAGGRVRGAVQDRTELLAGANHGCAV